MDFASTRASVGRSIWSYGKVQVAVSNLIRNQAMFYRPFPREAFFLDIGPGPNLSPDFYNIDWFWRPGIHRCMDVTRGMGLPRNRVAGVFTEHCLEHIPREACVRVLTELHDAMMDGCWLRVSMPDLETYARRYVQSLDVGVNTMPYEQDKDAAPALGINAVMREYGHRFIYDFDMLKRILERIGFRSITRCEYKQGHDPALLKDSDWRRPESFYVEAEKKGITPATQP